MDMVLLIPLAIGALIFLTLVLGSFFTVNTAQVAIITRFGKFLRVAEAGSELEGSLFRYRCGHRQPARQPDRADHGDQDQGQRLRHHPDLGAESRSPREGLRRVLQAVRPGGADQVLCRAGHPWPRAQHDARRSLCLAIQYRRWPSNRNSIPTWPPLATRSSTCW